MEQELISVIVPIYKVEKYLGKCVDSLCNQTYRNLEIILVDDGSPDSCGQMCEDYAKKDDRIIVIHKKNGGLSDARNAGIDVANGKYLGFVDSDDYIHPQMYELLYKELKKDEADISVCKFVPVEDGEVVDYPNLQNYKTKYLEFPNDYYQYAFNEKTMDIFTVAWNKLYKRELFNVIRYPFGKIHEDEYTTYKLFFKSKKVAYIEEDLYYYVQRAGSIMANGFDERSLHKFGAYDERLALYEKNNKYDWYERVLFMYRLYLVRFHKLIVKSNGDLSVLDQYKAKYKEYVMRSWTKIPVSFKVRLGYLYSGIFIKKYFNR